MLSILRRCTHVLSVLICPLLLVTRGGLIPAFFWCINEERGGAVVMAFDRVIPR